MGKTLDGYPTWNQRHDPDASGKEDAFSTTDCGEECCSIVLYALLRVYTTESQVRAAMPGHQDHGETTAADIDLYLSKAGLYPLLSEQPAELLKSALKGSVDAGMPSICLGYYVDTTILHWVVVIGYGNDHVIYVDPWYGDMLCSGWSVFLAHSTGTRIEVGKRSQRM